MPVNFDLSSLDGTNGFRLSGVAANDFSGRSVSGAGDVNGDGFADLIIGADGADPNGNSSSGVSYVVFGKASGFPANLDLSSLTGTNGFRLSGEVAGDRSGFSVSDAGDVNGDGFADLIVGTYDAGPNGPQSGASYVVFGKASAFASNLDLSALDGTNGFQLSGVEEYDLSGMSVSSAGDVNGDGFDDLIVGAKGADPNGSSSGASYVVFGKSSVFAADLNLSLLNGMNGFRLSGEVAGDRSGISVSAAGDVNGDGFDDLIVGANGSDSNGSYSGASYVVFGKASDFDPNLDLSTLNGDNGFRLSGAEVYDHAGVSVSAAGDVNGDGFDDLIVGANFAGPNGPESGASYVVFGKASDFDSNLNLSTLNGDNGFRLSGEEEIDHSGFSVSSAGDVNGDGFDDLIVGAYLADPNGSESGASYVVFGRASGFAPNLELSALDGTNGFRISGEAAADYSGFSVSAAGDVNGDGFDDLIIGAYHASPNGNPYSGASYVLYGSNFNDAVTHLGGAGADSLTGTDGADALVGGLGNDTLLGGDGNDALRGGAGDDWLDGEAGADRMVGGSGNDTYVVDSLADRVEEDSAGGVDTVRTSVAFSLEHRHELENLTLLGSDDLNALGNNKDNVLVGNAGNNLLDGGPGTDTASYTDAASAVSVNLGVASAQNTIGAGTDTLISIENLTGSGFSDTLTGNSGNNVLNGGAGADTMLGGAGNDTYVVDNAGDAVTENPSEGTDTVQSSISYTLGANVENLTLTGTGNINGTGNGLANVLTGNSGDNVIDGSAGADSIDGGSGSDTIVYDAADTQVNGGAGTDTLLVTGSQVALDLTLIPDTVLVNLEQIDITGSGNNALIVTASDVLALSSMSDTLLVNGNAGDTVTATDDWLAAGTTTISSILYNVYTSGGATLQVQSGVTFSDLNHAPTGADATLATNEDTQRVVTAADFGYGDLDGDAFASVKITALESAGALKLNGADVALDDVITKADIDAGLLTFDPAPNANGAAYATFGFKVSDGTLFSTAANAITVNVGAVNDAPLAVADMLSATEDTPVIYTAAQLLGNDTDVDNTNAQLSIASVTSGTGGTAVLNGDGTVSFTPGADLNGAADFSYTATDGTDSSNTAAVMVNVGAVNDAPVGAVSIVGVVTQGETLTASNTLVDADGLGTIGYQWQADGINIGGATADTLVLAGAQVGKVITVIASYLDGGGTAESVSSAATVAVSGFQIGTSGDDSLTGTPFGDTLIGGAGNDTYVVNSTLDVVTEGLNGGTDLVQSTVSSYTLSANVENLTLLGVANINGTGNTLNNVLTGNAGNNVLNGGVGADTMVGGLGNDTYVVNSTLDVVTEGLNGGTDLVQSTAVAHTLSANVENLTLLGVANINGTGNTLNNVLTGNAGNNVLNGGVGADTMVGGLGNDTYVVNSTLDVVTEGLNGGTDLVQSTAVAHTLSANVENLTLLGVANINGTGNTLNNVLTGNAGNNVLNGGVGADTMVGGLGNDTYVVNSTLDVVTEGLNGGTDLVQSTAVAHTLSANVENLTLLGVANINGTGNTLNNVLTGNAGNNVLNGGVGADTMVGGLGNDTYVVNSTLDVVTEGLNGGTDLVQSTAVAHTLSANVENLTLLGVANINGTGNTLNNVLTGNAGNNVLNGGVGADTMVGGLGNDTYVVNSTLDVVTEGLNGGTDLVQSTAVAHTLSANVENLTLLGVANINGTGNTLNNVLTGNAGNNVLNGSTGTDTASYAAATAGVTVNLGLLVAQNTIGAGTDTLTSIENLTGSAFNDTLTGNTGNNVLEGGTGNDLLNGGTGTDTASYAGATAGVTVNLAVVAAQNTVGAGSDTLASIESLLGSGFNDTLTGNAGVNSLNGGAGNDTLAGGLGNDTLIGGAGLDAFLFNTALGATNIDTVSGFTVVDDTIRLENAIFASLITPGALAAANFCSGAGIMTAADENDFLIFNTTTGQLFYDANGSAAGAEVHFATLTGIVGTVTAADFLIV